MQCMLQAEDMREKLLRTLADMENLRERTARTTAEAKQFAVQASSVRQTATVHLGITYGMLSYISTRTYLGGK
jgi:hypothetical protein